MIRSGALRRCRLTFQTRTETSDGLGPDGTVTWADMIQNYPAERWSVDSKQRVEAARTGQKNVIRWHCRYDPRIVSTMRIKLIDAEGTHYQEILTVNKLDQKNREIEILSEEKL